MKKIAIIIAGGSGKRMGQDIPKQFINVGEKPIIVYTLEAFQKHPSIDNIIVVCIDGWHDILSAYAKQFNITKLCSIVSGGSCGQESIKNGLDEAARLFDKDDMVLIHDAIRPMVSNDIISDNIAKCKLYGNATVVAPCTTVVLEKTDETFSEKVINRDNLLLTQTPQAFDYNLILRAHQKFEGKNYTDDSGMVEDLGEAVYVIDGSYKNIKITTQSDIELAKIYLLQI